MQDRFLSFGFWQSVSICLIPISLPHHAEGRRIRSLGMVVSFIAELPTNHACGKQNSPSSLLLVTAFECPPWDGAVPTTLKRCIVFFREASVNMRVMGSTCSTNVSLALQESHAICISEPQLEACKDNMLRCLRSTSGCLQIDGLPSSAA